MSDEQTSNTFRVFMHIGDTQSQVGSFHANEDRLRIEKRLLEDDWEKDGRGHFVRYWSKRQDIYFV
jgi:hypothetical protein